ncbi:hypothetical protein KEM48_006739, partial [Puccinia striiformis f. sp. tritici PST-130]
MTPPTLRPRNSNGTSRARKPSGSVPTPLVDPALPPLPPPPTYAEIPPPSSPSGRAIQPVLHQDELQQGVASGRAQPIQPRSNPSPPLALPGRFPRTASPKKPREHLNPHERMESHELDSTRLPPPAATTSGTSSGAEISHVPAQKPPFPPRHIPTPRTRQDSPSGTQHAEPSRRTLSRVGTESPQSFYSSSKDAPDAPSLHSPVPKHEPSASDLSLNSHWKQYLRAVHEQCVVGFQSNMKLHDMMVKQFRKITAHEDHRVDLEDHSLAEIKLCLRDVESKVDQLHVVIPRTKSALGATLQEHHRDNRALLEAQFNTFQDVLSRVEAQSVHASLTLNTLEAKLVSSFEHQLQGIQTRISCNCLNSNAHTACHQAPSQVNSSTPPGQEMSRISPPGEEIKIVPSISPTPAPQQTFNHHNTKAENNASPAL